MSSLNELSGSDSSTKMGLQSILSDNADSINPVSNDQERTTVVDQADLTNNNVEHGHKSDEEEDKCDSADSALKLKDEDDKEYTFLEAAEHGKIDLVKRFLKLDPTLINTPDEDGYTALHRASYSCQTNMVKYLIQNGANVCARTLDGWQPIHSASQWGKVQIVRILLSAGADINSKTNGGNTPFHLAATRAPKNRDLVEYFVFRDDVDIDAKNDAGDTAYDICKRNSMLYKLWELL